MKMIDPACGSGIFLRILLEEQANPYTSGATSRSIAEAFRAVQGVDRDPNAVAATKLSLALLHLTVTGKLPSSLRIDRADAIELLGNVGASRGAFSVVVCNPPFDKLDDLNATERSVYLSFLAADAKGRIAAYLAFLKLAIELVGGDGFVCMVLPSAFLEADNAAL